MPEYKIALEYQGEQHFSPIDIFGGEEGLKNSQARDKRKKQLSTRNGISLIEVLPGYEISDVIMNILQLRYGDDPQNEYRLNEALSKVELLESSSTESNTVEDVTEGLKKKQKKAEITDAQISAYIDELLQTRKTPQFNTGGKKLADATDSMLRKLDEVCEVSKKDPELSNRKAWELFESGYRYPALFKRMAINYRKLGLVEEEIDVLVCYKRMYPDSSDDRLRKLLKKKLQG